MYLSDAGRSNPRIGICLDAKHVAAEPGRSLMGPCAGAHFLPSFLGLYNFLSQFNGFANSNFQRN